MKLNRDRGIGVPWVLSKASLAEPQSRGYAPETQWAVVIKVVASGPHSQFF